MYKGLNLGKAKERDKNPVRKSTENVESTATR